MKAIFKIIIFTLLIRVGHAQQVVMFNHYFYKPMINNPAYTGIDNVANVMLMNHTQWTGFKGGPQYNVLSFDGRLINKNTGLGATVISDKKGINNRVGGSIFYSYRLHFKNKINIQLGLSAGIINQSIDYSKAITESQNDPSLFSNTQNKTSFDANVGLAFIYKDFDFGFAVPQLANNKISYVSNNDTRTFYTQSRHYIGSVKYKFLLSKAKEISITPQVLSRYLPNTPMQYDINTKLDWQNKVWLGATYKNNYALGLNLGVVLYKRFTIGYSYDYVLGNLNKNAGLSHEIILNFKFIKKEKTPEQIEDELLKKLSGQDLNKILIQRLLKKIETVLDKEKTTPEELQALAEEISSFLDETSTDPIQATLNKYYKSLKNQAQGELNVLVKGKIIIEGNEINPDFSKAKITIIDLGTKKVVATSTPAKDGKYYVILKPGKKYEFIVEIEGYLKQSKTLSLSVTSESYEMSQEIRMTK